MTNFCLISASNGPGQPICFSMLKLMFGDAQMSSLMDMIQAALMLKYNGRKIG